MALPKTETFTDSDATLLDAHDANWVFVDDGPFDAEWTITSNSVYASLGGFTQTWWAGDTFDNDQYAEAEIVSIDDTVSGQFGVAVRCDTGGTTRTFYYFIFRNFAGGNRILGKVVAGTDTVLDSEAGDLAVNDVLRLEVSGTSLSAKVNDTEILSATDSSITSGAAGLAATNTTSTTNRLDNWEGGNLGGSSTQGLSQLGTHGMNTLTGGFK